MAHRLRTHRFTSDILAVYVVAFTVATFAFVQGLFARNPTFLALAAWLVFSILVLLVRRTTSRPSPEAANKPAVRVGLDGWAPPLIMISGIVAMLIPIVLLFLRR